MYCKSTIFFFFLLFPKVELLKWQPCTTVAIPSWTTVCMPRLLLKQVSIYFPRSPCRWVWQLFSRACEQKWNLLALHLGHVTRDRGGLPPAGVFTSHRLSQFTRQHCVSHEARKSPQLLTKNKWREFRFLNDLPTQSPTLMVSEKRTSCPLTQPRCVESLPRFITCFLGEVQLMPARRGKYKVEQDSFEHC